jgi:hypothetical protein
MPKLATVIVPRNIWVRIDKKTREAIPDSVSVRKSQNDEVEWFSEDGQGYTVRFGARSPFQEHEFHVPKGGSVCSGPPHDGTRPDECYKYDILDGSVLMADPQIIIKN